MCRRAVAHLDVQPRTAAVHPHADGCARRVPAGVGQRLLDDADGGELQARGRRVLRWGQRQFDVAAGRPGLVHDPGQVGEARLRTQLLLLVRVAQQTHHAAHLGQRPRGGGPDPLDRHAGPLRRPRQRGGRGVGLQGDHGDLVADDVVQLPGDAGALLRRGDPFGRGTLRHEFGGQGAQPRVLRAVLRHQQPGGGRTDDGEGGPDRLLPHVRAQQGDDDGDHQTDGGDRCRSATPRVVGAQRVEEHDRDHVAQQQVATRRRDQPGGGANQGGGRRLRPPPGDRRGGQHRDQHRDGGRGDRGEHDLDERGHQEDRREQHVRPWRDRPSNADPGSWRRSVGRSGAACHQPAG